MHHIGNDIVDLNAPAAIGKSGDEKFIKRVLTDRERRLVICSRQPDVMLWVLWAAKETAYKALSKADRGIIAAPGKYSVAICPETNSGTFTGIVQYGVMQVQTMIYCHGDVIHAIGTTGSMKNTKRLLFGFQTIEVPSEPNYNQSSRAVSQYTRRYAKSAIAEQLGCNPNDITISNRTRHKRRTYPIIRLKHQPLPLDISLSHDGLYAAYAFCIND